MPADFRFWRLRYKDSLPVSGERRRHSRRGRNQLRARRFGSWRRDRQAVGSSEPDAHDGYGFGRWWRQWQA